MKNRIPRRAVQGILLLDKPLGISSNDALQRVKRLYRAEKAGHTGNLDPLATGLLPICFGQATKLSGQLLDSDKAYTATIRFGEQSETGDAEGAIIARSDASQLTRDQLEAVLPQFLGAIRQIPPMYSAIQKNGVRLYELARQGETVEREAREVTIHELRVIAFSPASTVLHVRCSKGTYIRTLAEDIAKAMGQVAHLTGLRRTAVTPFSSERMLSWEQLEALAAQGEQALDAQLLDAAHALVGWTQIVVNDIRAHQLSRGMVIRVPAAPRATSLAVLGPNQALLCLAESDEEGYVAPKRWLGH